MLKVRKPWGRWITYNLNDLQKQNRLVVAKKCFNSCAGVNWFNVHNCYWWRKMSYKIWKLNWNELKPLTVIRWNITGRSVSISLEKMVNDWWKSRYIEMKLFASYNISFHAHSVQCMATIILLFTYVSSLRNMTVTTYWSYNVEKECSYRVQKFSWHNVRLRSVIYMPSIFF